MTETLLSTKFFIPPLAGDGLVQRSTLHRILTSGTRTRLTLISAPAGFGKSTLVASWLSGYPARAAWVSLDAEDNDPGVFWQYVLAALQTVEPDFGLDARQIISSPQLLTPQPALVSMLNEISNRSLKFTLVLDDYHVIDSQDVHDSLSFFIEHLPATTRIVLLTRIDPPLSLGRLRAQGDLTEIRAEDLQFSPEEASDFLERVMGLTLSQEQVAALENRTEGWVVGLKLAGLSLQRQSNIQGFIDDFSGSHQYILEYLTEEVMGTLADSTRAFLLRTSILDSFCAALCEAVSQDTDSRQIIDSLTADNLFVIPLDPSGDWFRYHHLFAELLQTLLRREFADEIPELHLRSAAWYQEMGYLAQAAEHVFRSGDLEQARRYVVDNWNAMLHRGRVNTVLKWVGQLPDEMARKDVYLALANCWARYLSGRTPAMAPYVDYAEVSFNRLVDQDILNREQRGFVGSQVYMMRSALLLSQGQFAESVRFAEKAVEIVPAHMGIAAGPAWNLLGAARVGAGDIDGGIEAYQHGMGIAYAAENYLSAFAAVFWSTIYLIRQGRLKVAHQRCRQAYDRAVQDGLTRVPAFGLLYVALALIALERNRLNEAREWVEQGGGFSEALRYGRTIRARLHLALGEPEIAISMLEDVERIVMATGEPHAIAEMHIEWAKLHIQQGNTDAVRERLLSLRQMDAAQLEYPLLRFSVDWLSAYVAWCNGAVDKALDTLDAAIDRTRDSCSEGDRLRFLVLKALVLDTIGKPRESHAALEEGLTIGMTQGYLRTWLDAGKEIGPLLNKVKQNTDLSPTTRSYVDDILALCEATYDEDLFQDELAALLTDRELDILRLLCRGCSNAEIAEQLVVTLNTVKKHTSNIYSKLGVASRTQAAAKAREFGFMP